MAANSEFTPHPIVDAVSVVLAGLHEGIHSIHTPLPSNRDPLASAFQDPGC